MPILTRMLERQSEVREDLLRRSQSSLDFKEKQLKDKDMVIRRMEKEFERFDDDRPSSSSLVSTTAIGWRKH